MEALAAQLAHDEVLLRAKRPAQVAHLLKDEHRVVEAAPDGVRVVAVLVVLVPVVVDDSATDLFLDATGEHVRIEGEPGLLRRCKLSALGRH